MIRSRLVPGMVAVAFLLGLFSPFRPTLHLTAQSDVRYFPETKHYVKGLFLKYWNEHGGLAQQGYPLTEEFTEPSKLDPGKSYTVQYFERAVFERHPENAGTPYEVLLTQLGKYELDSRYPNNSNPAAAPQPGPTGPPPATATTASTPSGSQQFSGSSDQVTAPFSLHKGLVVFHDVCTACEGYFSVTLIDANAKLVALATSVVAGGDYSAATNVPTDGQYSLQVKAEGAWTITVSQPTATYSSPPATQTWQGHLHQASPLFSLKAGSARFHAVATNGQGYFGVKLLDASGNLVGLVASKVGPADVSTAVNITKNGVYILDIDYDADWTVTVQQ